tara:strand:- start:305 stop:529 length:225 start_codon:yes stop_codon:yes gene_type:complete
MKADFKPIHFFNHSTNESFKIVSREGLIDWINDYTENYNAFDTFQELRERCLTEHHVGVSEFAHEVNSEVSYNE